jgi:hypothetical protein
MPASSSAATITCAASAFSDGSSRFANGVCAMPAIAAASFSTRAAYPARAAYRCSP